MRPIKAWIIPIEDAAPGQPPGIWGGSNEPFPGYGLPGQPPGIWGPTDPRPGYGLPGRPPGTWGGAGEPFPTPPIVIPPQKPGDPPLVIWGPNDPRPTPPIHLPDQPDPPVGGDRVQLVEWHTAWSEETGWVVIGVPAGNVPHPAPSKK